MNCPNCQKDIAAGSNFCYNCGAKQHDIAAGASFPSAASRKRLVRSTNNRKIAGVCAGIAEYFDFDPTIVRLIWLLATLVPGPNIIAYIAFWIAVPEGPTGVLASSSSPVTS